MQTARLKGDLNSGEPFYLNNSFYIFNILLPFALI